MYRILWVALAATLIAPAFARENLRLKNTCPNDPTPCLEATLNFSEDNSGRMTKSNLPAYNETLERGPVEFRILIKGRLNGGPPTLFRLIQRATDDGETPYWEVGHVAFLGRSHDNRPIVLTNRGPLEIITKALDLSYGNDFMIADERTWRFKDAPLDVFNDGYLVTSPDTIAIWRPKQKLCIAAPVAKPGMLRLSANGCRRKKDNLQPAIITLANMRKLIPYAHIGPETDENNLSVKRSEFGGEGGYYWVYRIPKTHTLIITAMYDNC